MTKTELRQKAAIAALPQCITTVNQVLMQGGSLTEETPAKQAAHMAVLYADALVEKLSKTEE